MFFPKYLYIFALLINYTWKTASKVYDILNIHLYILNVNGGKNRQQSTGLEKQECRKVLIAGCCSTIVCVCVDSFESVCVYVCSMAVGNSFSDSPCLSAGERSQYKHSNCSENYS